MVLSTEYGKIGDFQNKIKGKIPKLLKEIVKRQLKYDIKNYILK